MLDTFVPAATYANISDILQKRYADVSSWITFPIPADPAQDALCRKAIEALKG
jgi:hypothetical protein